MPAYTSTNENYLAVTPSDDINSRRRNIYAYPPTPQDVAKKLMEMTGIDLIEPENEDGMSMYVARPHQVKLTDEQIIEAARIAYSEASIELKQFPGLAEQPNWDEWRSYVKNSDE